METEQGFRSGFVALVGEPNVGKSTLLNTLLGQKISIVTPKPQTTRHKLLGILSTEHCQIVFLDTPGIITPRYALQEAMMKHAASALNDADVVLFMVDAARKAIAPDAAGEALKGLAQVSAPIFLVLNKCDRTDAASLVPVREFYKERVHPRKLFMISALKGEGTADLVDAVRAELPVHPPFFPLDQVSERQERFFVAEIIREKVFLKTQEEIPYATSIEIVEFKEREEGKWFISADVYVERDSQKGILIGAKGAKMKEIGAAARREIEEFLEHPVFLELHVKVRERWREKPDWLQRLGYTEQ